MGNYDFLAGNGETVNIEEEVFSIFEDFGYTINLEKQAELLNLFERL